MSGLAHGEFDTPEFRRCFELLEDARAHGDLAMVAECESYLRRFGKEEPVPAPVVEQAVPVELEHAVPVKRGPGRPRKSEQ